jgi:N-methylhydantoinase A
MAKAESLWQTVAAMPATNLLVEREGARLALITTAGLRDLLELRGGLKPNRYDVCAPFPEPLIPRRLRREAPERVRLDASSEAPLNEDAARAALAALIAPASEAEVDPFASIWIHHGGAK